MWMRDLKDNVTSASSVLSAVYTKYQNVNSTFYSELTSNTILRFDLFYDTFFIETHLGYIFEKFYIEDDQVKPYNQLNLLNYKKTTSVDYWFDEKKNKVFYTEIYCYDNIYEDPLNENYFNFVLILKSFDCNTGLSKLILLDLIKIAYTDQIDWQNDHFYVENPKLTYNSDTKTFNVSFIIRNSKFSFGLISINVLNAETPYVTEVNGFLPYMTIDTLNSFVSAIKDLPDVSEYGFVETELGYILSTEASEYLSYD